TTAIYRVLGGGCSLFGDVNGACSVDFLAFFAVLAALGPCGGCPEDLNADGRVDLFDVLLVFRALRDQYAFGFDPNSIGGIGGDARPRGGNSRDRGCAVI
ncbi:MAG: hypothetical protein ACFCBV_07880, partial [Phycisphaerales bacterium]